MPALWLGVASCWSLAGAAFSAVTSNGDSSFTTGTVTMTDHDGAAATLSGSGLLPGDTGSRCYPVTYTGSLPASMRLFRSSSSETNGIGPWLRLEVHLGLAGSFGDCGSGFKSHQRVYFGTFSDFATTRTSYATGVGAYAAAGGSNQRIVYRLRYHVDASAPASTAGGSFTLNVTARAENT